MGGSTQFEFSKVVHVWKSLKTGGIDCICVETPPPQRRRLHYCTHQLRNKRPEERRKQKMEKEEKKLIARKCAIEKEYQKQNHSQTNKQSKETSRFSESSFLTVANVKARESGARVVYLAFMGPAL